MFCQLIHVPMLIAEYASVQIFEANSCNFVMAKDCMVSAVTLKLNTTRLKRIGTYMSKVNMAVHRISFLVTGHKNLSQINFVLLLISSYHTEVLLFSVS